MDDRADKPLPAGINRSGAEGDLGARLAASEAQIVSLRRRNVELEGAEHSLRALRQEHRLLQQRYNEALAAFGPVQARRPTLPTSIRRGLALMRPIGFGAVAWLTFRPDSRPHRIVRAAATRLGLVALVARLAPKVEVEIYWLFVDHTVDCPTNTGVQRVVRGLAKALMDSGRVVRFVRWSSAAAGCVLIDSEQRRRLAQWNGPAMSDAETRLYGRPAAKRRAIRPKTTGWLIVPEVSHAAFQKEPLTARLAGWARHAGLRTGFVFYDAIPLKRREFQALAPTHSAYMRELRLADAVWPISRWSASELAAFWGAGPDTASNAGLPRIRPIHLPAEFDRPRQTDVTAGENLILSVGTLEPRKNQTALIRAFQAVMAERPDCGWRLVLVGNLHPDVADEVNAANRPGSAIEFLGHVSDDALSRLYDQCAFTVFPSVEEGYGLPILESLWRGKPCICADFGAMAEVATGGGCLTIDVRDDDVLKAALLRLMDRPGDREVLARQAVSRPMTGWADYVAALDDHKAGLEPVIYYWVDATISYPGNTGIQRIARQLARGLIDRGLRLVPVKWGGVNQPFQPVSAEELQHFALWNGPAADRWIPWVDPQAHKGGGWFMMTELPLNLSDDEQQLVRKTAEAAGLKTAAVFYDTIPWKMRDIYPAPFAEAHRLYIRELANYSRVLPISHYSRSEMAAVLIEQFGLAADQFGHIQACPLAGEFPQALEEQDAELGRVDGAVNILCVGTIEPRKNHEALLDAFDLACRVSAKPLHLTLAGSGHSFDNELPARVRTRIQGDPRIDWVEQADDGEINRLYAACDFTVYPSVEEGFGLPILESLWRGRPVICANFGAMAEVAEEGGGCLMVDTRDPRALAHAMVKLANDPNLLARLAAEIPQRTFKSWSDYASDVARALDLWILPGPQDVALRRRAMGLPERPILSVCISTYNRAEWLRTALRNIAQLYPEPVAGVEFVVCDNASTDHTPDVVRAMLSRPDIAYRRNPANVGMLGNLRETARVARGDYIWILGDDDLLRGGSVERVLAAIAAVPDVALVYLNYAYTGVTDARTIADFNRFFLEATPIVLPEGDRIGPIREICARNENFFTAIYTLVFRRDHALAAYSQDTSGRPFSTMLNCIPTTHYVLNTMMEQTGVWIGDPQLVVNLNVSWMRYAPLWILERIPEVYELARQKGVAAEDIDRWRRHTLPDVQRYFAQIFTDDPLNNAAYLSVSRLVRRFSDLPEFEAWRPAMREAYARAHAQGHPAAAEPPEAVFEARRAERIE